MKEETRDIAAAGIQQAINGGVVASAVGVLSGAVTTMVTTTTPITVLWGLFTVGTSAVAAPVVVPAALAACAVGGAVAGGTAGAVFAYRRIRRDNDEFENLKNGKK